MRSSAILIFLGLHSVSCIVGMKRQQVRWPIYRTSESPLRKVLRATPINPRPELAGSSIAVEDGEQERSEQLSPGPQPSSLTEPDLPLDTDLIDPMDPPSGASAEERQYQLLPVFDQELGFEENSEVKRNLEKENYREIAVGPDKACPSRVPCGHSSSSRGLFPSASDGNAGHTPNQAAGSVVDVPQSEPKLHVASAAAATDTNDRVVMNATRRIFNTSESSNSSGEPESWIKLLDEQERLSDECKSTCAHALAFGPTSLTLAPPQPASAQAPLNIPDPPTPPEDAGEEAVLIWAQSLSFQQVNRLSPADKNRWSDAVLANMLE